LAGAERRSYPYVRRTHGQTICGCAPLGIDTMQASHEIARRTTTAFRHRARLFTLTNNIPYPRPIPAAVRHMPMHMCHSICHIRTTDQCITDPS
jgi:hypothetical protein